MCILYTRLFYCAFLKNSRGKNSSFFQNSRPKTQGLFQNSTYRWVFSLIQEKNPPFMGSLGFKTRKSGYKPLYFVVSPKFLDKNLTVTLSFQWFNLKTQGIFQKFGKNSHNSRNFWKTQRNCSKKLKVPEVLTTGAHGKNAQKKACYSTRYSITS